MPFLGYDPCELGCFDAVDAPDDVLISTTSGMSWDLYRRHNWVHNKLDSALSQGLARLDYLSGYGFRLLQGSRNRRTVTDP